MLITGDTLRDHIAVTANGFIGLPYQWGDISPTKGFDCSSLVMAVFQLNGLVVPRTSKDQFTNGVPVDPENLNKGDLLFFTTNGTGQISHVGIYVGDGMFIHAPGKGKPIRQESLNTQYYRDRYMGACTLPSIVFTRLVPGNLFDETTNEWYSSLKKAVN